MVGYATIKNVRCAQGEASVAIAHDRSSTGRLFTCRPPHCCLAPIVFTLIQIDINCCVSERSQRPGIAPSGSATAKWEGGERRSGFWPCDAPPSCSPTVVLASCLSRPETMKPQPPTRLHAHAHTRTHHMEPKLLPLSSALGGSQSPSQLLENFVSPTQNKQHLRPSACSPCISQSHMKPRPQRRLSHAVFPKLLLDPPESFPDPSDLPNSRGQGSGVVPLHFMRSTSVSCVPQHPPDPPDPDQPRAAWGSLSASGPPQLPVQSSHGCSNSLGFTRPLPHPGPVALPLNGAT